MNSALAKYYRDAATDYALRPDAGREDTASLIESALKRAYGWRVENPGPIAEAVVALLEQARDASAQA